MRKIVYVPYYVNPGFISEDYNELPLLYRSDYIIVQSEKAKETCKGFPYYDRILPLGSPKFDKVINLYNKKQPHQKNGILILMEKMYFIKYNPYRFS